MSSPRKDNRVPGGTMVRAAWGLALALVAAPPAGAQEPEALLLMVGRDTIAREMITRSADRLEGTLLSPMLGVRFSYLVEFAPGGVPRRMLNRFWQAADPDTLPPRQVATVTFVGDSALVDIEGGPTQRLATEAGAIPFLNPSFALLELALLRMAAAGADSIRVPGFMLEGGRTMSLTLVRIGPDSVRVDIAGAVARLRVDGRQRILGGAVPAQGLRLERVRGGTGVIRGTAPDYRAPPGAPYEAIEVRIPTPMGHVLAGTLTLPHGAGPARRVPAMVTSTGSGPQERDERIMGVTGYALFRQVADTLSRHGIAVLRMDDRGQGASGGRWAGATTADFADDVRAGLDWLRQHPTIDASRLGVIGHSEGGIVAPMVAATDSTLRAIVLLAGPARVGRRVVQFQQRQAIEAATGVTPAQRDSIYAAAQVSLDSLARLDPWLSHFLAFDPLPLAARIRAPAVLIVHGGTDRQITADQASEWEAAFRAAGNPDVTMRIFAEANHLLVQDPVGHLNGYAALPSKAVRPDILATVLTWLQARLRAR